MKLITVKSVLASLHVKLKREKGCVSRWVPCMYLYHDSYLDTLFILIRLVLALV